MTAWEGGLTAITDDQFLAAARGSACERKKGIGKRYVPTALLHGPTVQNRPSR